jgi:hypothetical protein
MVWGGISHVGKTDLKIMVGNLNGIRYRDEILAPIVLPFIRTHHFNHVFSKITLDAIFHVLHELP